jgi:CBS domain-containing membrane protein
MVGCRQPKLALRIAPGWCFATIVTEPRPSRALFRPILAGARLPDRLLACLGALLAIAATRLVTGWMVHGLAPIALPALVAPIGASALLLFVVPAIPLAQPWPIIGGNIVSGVVGVAAGQLIPYPALAAGVAVGGAILAMSLLRCLHPPSAAAALVGVVGGPAIVASSYLFPVAPLALNSLILVAAGTIFHRVSGHSYPHRPLPLPAPEPLFHRDDIDRALAEAGEAFDISRADLDGLLVAAERHAQARHGVLRN